MEETLAIQAALAGTQTEEEQAFLLEEALRGYSAAALALHFRERFGEERQLSKDALESFCHAVRLNPALRGSRTAEEEAILSLGLSRKAERVRRLASYAERTEGRALDSPAWGKEHRLALEQIHQEVEPLGLDVTIFTTDPYGRLLIEIREMVRGRPARVELTNERAGELRIEPPGGDAE